MTSNNATDLLLEVFNKTGNCIVTTDDKDIIIYANPAFAELFGFDVTSIMGKNIWNLYPENLRENVHTTVAEAIGKKEVRRVEWEGLHVGGRWESTVYPSEKGVTTITKQITKCKEPEEVLANTRKELTTMLESIDAGFSSLDMNWRFVYVNSKAARNVGYEPEELIGKNLWEHFPKFRTTNAATQFQRVMTERITINFEEHDISTDHWYDGTVYPTTQGIAVLWRDITKHKKTEEAIDRQRRVGGAISRILKETLSAGDKKTLGRMCLSIAKELTQSKIGIIGEVNKSGSKYIAIDTSGTVCNILSPEGHNSLPDNFTIRGLYSKVLTDHKGFFTNDPTNHPASLGLPEHHPPLTSFLGVPLINKDTIIGVIALANREGGYTQNELESLEALSPSIVETLLRKQTEFKLESYSRHLESLVEERSRELKDKERLAAIGTTAGMVGHDIRNPLQAIVGDVYLMKEYLKTMPESKTKGDVTESLDSIDQNVGYINKIVADLQDYARPLNPEILDIDLAQLIGSIFSVIIIPSNIRFSVDIKGAPKLKTDPMFIRRALTNLVNNALQAMPNGGELSVEGLEHNNSVIITVSDTGVGIPKAVKAKLFMPMTTTKAKGQGLGLAVVKRLIETLGGNITFESQENKGTKFIITLLTKG